jgi:2'-5' RNA ligase
MANYCAETQNVAIIHSYHTKNTVLKNVISNLDDGITIIFFGNVSGQTYLSVMNILARFVKESFYIDIGGNLFDRKNSSVIILYQDHCISS